VPELEVALGGPGSPPQVLFPDIQTRSRAAVELEQPIWTGGAIASRQHAARDSVRAGEHERERAVASLRLAGQTAYWNAVAAAAGVDATTAQLERANQLLRDAQALRDAGMAVRADLLAAEARVRAAEAATVAARTDSAEALATLRSQTGLPPGTPITLADAAAPAIPATPEPVSQLIETAVTQRSELQVLAARRDATAAEQQLAAAALKPSLHAMAQWRIARPNQAIMPLEDTFNDSWSVGVTARWTVLDGDRTRSRVATVRAEVAALEAELAEVERQIRLEVERAHLRLVGALESVTASEASRAAAVARVEAERDRLNAGMATVSDVLEADSELALAEREVVASHARAWLAAAALDRAVGR
jgi:outer membrane protein